MVSGEGSVVFSSATICDQVYLSLKAANLSQDNAKGFHLIAILDESGSMAGSYMNEAKEGTKALLEASFLVPSVQKITLIPFSSTCTVLDFSPQTCSLEGAKALVDSRRAGGGTFFNQPLAEMICLVKQNPELDTVVVILSDGQPSDGNEVQDAQIKKVLSEQPNNITMNVIGLSAHHDAAFMSRMSQLGKTPGVFQFCALSTELKSSIELVAGSFGSSVTARLVSSSGQDIIVNLIGETDELGDTTFSGWAFVDSIQGLTLNIASGEQLLTFPVEDVQPLDESRILSATLRYYSTRVKSLVEEASNGENKAANVLDHLEALDKQFREAVNTANSSKALKGMVARKEFLTTANDVSDQILELRRILLDVISGSMTNVILAQLSSLASREAKKSLLKRLDKVKAGNALNMDKLQSELTALSADVDASDLSARCGALVSTIGTCAHSHMDFIEALTEADAMCLSFNMNRSQAAIADPSQLNILNVCPTFMTAQSFLLSAEFSLSANPNAAGGFSREQGELARGAAKESITGVLPLFLTPEHWKLASLLMKPIMGFVTTTDPLGYMSSQTRTVPFMVFETAWTAFIEKPTEFNLLVVQLVAQTCVAIVNDYSQPRFNAPLAAEVAKLFREFLENPAGRTVDVISSLGVFVVQVLTAVWNGTLPALTDDEIDRWFLLLLEESLRRHNLTNVSDTGAHYLLKLFGVDTQKVIDAPVAAFCAKLNSGIGASVEDKFREHFETYRAGNAAPKLVATSTDASSGAPAAEECSVDSFVQVDEKDLLAVVRAPYAQNALLAEYVKNWETVLGYSRRLANLKSLFKFFQTPEKRTLVLGKALEDGSYTLTNNEASLQEMRSLPLETNLLSFVSWNISQASLLGLLVQNQRTRRNADRREVIQSGAFVDAWNETAAEKFLFDLLITQIRSSLQAGMASASEEHRRLLADQDAAVFAATSDLAVAAGCLAGTYQGRVNFPSFARALYSMQSDKKVVKAKLLMMMQNDFEGCRLYLDKVKSKEKATWKPSRKFIAALYRRHAESFTEAEWFELFPDHKDAIQFWVTNGIDALSSPNTTAP